MARIAYLGPECSFSHDLLRDHFTADEHVGLASFHEVVSAVASGTCPKGVVPFYNTTRLSIEESQRELLAGLGKVIVTDVIPFDVHHYLCAFCPIPDIRELWSKSVVYHQASQWLAANLPAVAQLDRPSTSAAISELAASRQPGVAAIGTISAARRYRVPIVARRIQNKPNITLFFVVENGTFRPEAKDHVLLCLKRPTERNMQLVSDLVTARHCHVASNWLLDAGQPSSAYFVEVSNRLSTLDLHAAVDSVQRHIPRVHVCGGYTGKSITDLIWNT